MSCPWAHKSAVSDYKHFSYQVRALGILTGLWILATWCAQKLWWFEREVSKGSGTTRSCVFGGAGVASLEEVRHCGCRLWGPRHCPRAGKEVWDKVSFIKYRIIQKQKYICHVSQCQQGALAQSQHRFSPSPVSVSLNRAHHSTCLSFPSLLHIFVLCSGVQARWVQCLADF